MHGILSIIAVSPCLWAGRRWARLLIDLMVVMGIILVFLLPHL